MNLTKEEIEELGEEIYKFMYQYNFDWNIYNIEWFLKNRNIPYKYINDLLLEVWAIWEWYTYIFYDDHDFRNAFRSSFRNGYSKLFEIKYYINKDSSLGEIINPIFQRGTLPFPSPFSSKRIIKIRKNYKRWRPPYLNKIPSQFRSSFIRKFKRFEKSCESEI